MGPPMTSSVTPTHCFHSFLVSLIESTMKNDRYYVNSEKKEEKSFKIEFFDIWGYFGGDDVIR